MIIMAIDPGNEESAYVLYDTETGTPTGWAKVDNNYLLGFISANRGDLLALEMVASYGMPVGAEVFETCVWIGRFAERWFWKKGVLPVPTLVYRKDVKMHLCGSTRAKDSNIRQALIDRYGGKEKAIGRKATPGPLYGMSGDCWSALAVAITAAESREAA
jgi:hypothetical protein